MEEEYTTYINDLVKQRNLIGHFVPCDYRINSIWGGKTIYWMVALSTTNQNEAYITHLKRNLLAVI